MSEQHTPEAGQATFSIQKLYMTDISLESPNAPVSFMEQAAPDITVNFQNNARSFDGGFFEVSLRATVQAKVGEQVMFLIEATQAGLFNIENIPEGELDPLLGIGCPNILFPYLREAVSDLTVRAGYAALLLQPVNFEAIYMQQRAAQEAQADSSNAQVTH